MIAHPDLLERVFQTNAGTFSPELARQILEFTFPPPDHARYEELSARAQEGTLSTAEATELDDYLNLNDFLMILKTKAQASLHKPAA